MPHFQWPLIDSEYLAGKIDRCTARGKVSMTGNADNRPSLIAYFEPFGDLLFFFPKYLFKYYTAGGGNEETLNVQLTRKSTSSNPLPTSTLRYCCSPMDSSQSETVS